MVKTEGQEIAGLNPADFHGHFYKLRGNII